MIYPAKADYQDGGFKAACRDFNIARRQFQYTGTKAAKADKTRGLREALARAEADEAAEGE